MSTRRVETYEDGELVDVDEVEVPDLPESAVDPTIVGQLGKGTTAQRVARIEQAIAALLGQQT